MTDSAAARLFQKVRWKRRGDAKWLTCQRMRHLELSGVQHRPHGATGSIEPVACQRVTDGGEMDANLMGAPSLERDIEQRALPRRVQWRDMRDRALAVLAHRELDRAGARDRRVDGLRFAELA